MELTRENFRSMIYYDFRQKLSQQQCVERMKSTFGKEAPSKTTIYRWFQTFKSGRGSLSDEFREGRPKSVVTPENIDAVREMIEYDRHVTYREIEASLDIGMSTINTILHNKLGVKKICSRWTPQSLTKDQKDARVEWCKNMLKRFNSGSSNLVFNIVISDETWIFSYEPETKEQSTDWVFQKEVNPKKLVKQKKMIVSFFSKTGHVATIALEDCKSVNDDWYTTICLPEMIAEVRKNNAEHQIILHHDNVRLHTTKQTIDYLKQQHIDLITQCQYSPDLSPNDFFLFPTIKNKMRGEHFHSPEEAVEAYKSNAFATPSSEWNKCFENWFIRMKKCIDTEGEYLEKQ